MTETTAGETEDSASSSVSETVGDGDGDGSGDGDGDGVGEACSMEWAEKDGMTSSIMDAWGAACMDDVDCEALLGPGALCLTDILGVFALPGGYCTKPCDLPDVQTSFVLDAPDCDPDGGVACVGAQGLFTACTVPCEGHSECGREGYGCQQMPVLGAPGDPQFCLMNPEECCLTEAGCV